MSAHPHPMDDTTGFADDGLDRLLEFEHREDMALIAAAAKKISKLNKAEILTLARHYGVKHPEDYAEPGEWRRGGKEELVNEVAAHYAGVD